MDTRIDRALNFVAGGDNLARHRIRCVGDWPVFACLTASQGADTSWDGEANP